MINLHTNQLVQTPNGPGIADSPIFENGCRYLIVRHLIQDMTSTEKGRCLTPDAKYVSYWAYEITEIQPLND
jgi:hypothetical protein